MNSTKKNAQQKKEEDLVLPFSWRQIASEKLAAKGIKLNTSQIYDIKRGKNNNENLTNEVFKILRQISRAHCAKKARLAKIRMLN